MGETGSRVGSRFGPYQLRRLLGRGGMGEVYEAYDTVKDRTVALKLMSAEVSADPVFRQRMQREAHTAGRLQEPHVVPIHDYGEIDGQLFIDMRMIEGTDVGALLERYGPLPPPRAVAIVRQVAAALDAAHAAGVMHRDIKPENILITGDDFAYLVDFGIAAAVTEEHLTQTGVAVGTWNYMAPERFGADEQVTYRADIYALACVLCECLTGRPPYSAGSLTTLVAAHLYQPIPRPSQLHPGIPAAFDNVIARGMAKNPADRYARAGDLAAAAHHALSAPDQHRAADIVQRSQQATLPTGPPPPWQTPPPWSRTPPTRTRTRWMVGGAVALVVVAVLAAVGIWLGNRSSPDGGQAAGAKPTTSPTAAPTVPTARLDSIMPNAGQVNSIMGSSTMQLAATTRQLDNTPYTLSNTDCLGALYSSMEAAYAGSGYTAVLAQVWQEPGGGAQLVFLGVVAYPSADEAAAFVSASAQKWKACAGQTVIQNQENGPSLAWSIGKVAGDPPAIAQLDTPKDHVPCQHALSAVSNVVLDAGVCGPRVSNEAKQLADAMAANVKT